jgi:hypothetical protein
MGAGSVPGVESGRDVTLTPHTLLVPRSKKQSRAIPLLSLRAFVAYKKNETYPQYIYYPDSNSGRHSAIFFLRIVSSMCPAITNQRTETPLALVPIFHGGNILVKSLPVFNVH